MAACSKIFGALTCGCCTCQADHDDHFSRFHQASNFSVPTHGHAHQANHDEHNRTRIGYNRKGANAKQHHASQQQPHGMQGPDSSDDRFSDFIKQAKVKIIRTMTMNVGAGKKQNASNYSRESQQNDTKNDVTFSEYIKRAKVKIRKTTSIASKKSFKGGHAGETT